MIRILTILLIVLPLPALSQNNINKTKVQVKKEYAGNITTETDSTLSFKPNTAGNISLEFTCSFDQKGKCSSEKIVTGCDSCYAKLLKDILAEKKYHWKRINENQFVSDFESRLMIELPVEKNIHTISILRMEWSKILYDILMEK